MGILLLGTPAVTGKALINDGSSGSSFIWANVLKTATNRGPQVSPTYPYPAYLDSNGYPNNAPSNVLGDNLQYLFGIPPEWGTAPLVASFSGTGAFYLQPAAIANVVITGTGVVNTSSLPTFLKVTGTDVRITFNFTTAPIVGDDTYTGYFLTGTTYNNMSKMVLCRASDEAAIIANPNALNPDYVAMLRALNPKTFRGLDISGANGANQSQFSQRPPAGAFSFFYDRFPPECWSGSAPGVGTSGSPYIVSTPSGWAGLVDGAAVQVQFTSANTGTQPVANVGGTGNIRITTLGPNDLGAGGITAGSIWTLVYSSVYNYWTGSVGGFVTRAPIEQHIAVANAINANLWYNISHRYSPADGTALTNVVKATLNSNLAFYPELSNEVWNSQFTQSSYIDNMGLTMGITSSGPYGRTLMGAYGLLVRRMMGAITTAWGGVDSRLRRVMGIQAYGDSGLSGQNNVYRFKGTDLAPGNAIYNAFSGSANYTASPDRPIDYCDVMSYATYYSGGELLQFDGSYVAAFGAGLNFNNLTTAADNFAAGGGGISTALAWMDNDIRAGARSDGVTNGTQTMADLNVNIYPAWETLAASYDASRPGIGLRFLTIECYEGAMAGIGPSAATCTTIGISTAYATKISDLMNAYKGTSLFTALVIDQYRQFMLSGPHATTPAWYQIVGVAGPWALTPGSLYTVPPYGTGQYKSWDGNVTFNH